MSPAVPADRGEAALVAAIGATLARVQGRPADLADDCAHLRGPTDLVTTDALLEGGHFDLRRDTWQQIGAQAAVANLSDLASSGAAGGWLVWSLVIPPHWTVAGVAALTEGFARVATRYGARVVGGNLSSARGPGVIAVTAGGPLWGPRPVTRSGAAPGDVLYVSGPLGDAALGFVAPDPEARRARHRWRPHLPEARRLVAWGRVSAMMDVSDGLLLDAARLADASGVAVDVHAAAVPLGPLLTARGGPLRLALSGGEDYVLLFTAPPGEAPPIPCWAVGRCAAGAGLTLDGAPTAAAGYDHFATPADPP